MRKALEGDLDVHAGIAPVFGIQWTDEVRTDVSLEADFLRHSGSLSTASWRVPVCQTNHVLVRDEEPPLSNAGLQGVFQVLRDAVATLIDRTQPCHLAWSQVEFDAIGGLNHWLELAPWPSRSGPSSAGR